MDSLDTLPTAQSTIPRVEAYRAMLQVLEYYFRLGHEYPMAAMLGDLATGTWDNGLPGDPAAWSLWLKAIEGNLVRAPNDENH
jgi:hypothetical protein